MAFDPDAYISSKEEFDPDTYIAESEPEKVPVDTEEDGLYKSYREATAPINEALMKVPGMSGIVELGSAINRGAVNLADYLTTGQVNAMLEVAGSDARVPTIAEQPFVKGATVGGTMEPGLLRNIVRTGGEMAGPGGVVGSVTRGMVGMLPKVAPAAQTMAGGMARQLGVGTVGGDVALSGVSGAGAETGREIGGETGALIGSLMAPVATMASKTALTKLIGMGASGISAFTKSMANMSDEGAATLMAEAMVREGLAPSDVAKIIDDLGPEALPADVGNNFARLLRTASNKIPRIEAQASEVFSARHKGQGSRISTALDDASGTASLTVDDEIARLDEVLKPQINAAYKAARDKSDIVFAPKKELPVGVGAARGRDQPSRPSEPATLKTLSSDFSKLGFGSTTKPKKLPVGVGPAKGVSRPEVKTKTLEPQQTRLQGLLSGKGVAGSKIKSKVDLELKAKTLSGEKVTKLDVIDATKRALDDEIQKAMREGSSNKARSLVSLKNTLIKEVDELIPEYKQARDLFAGKAELENAADLGVDFLKMKPRDMEQITASMGESEKRMFKLGAKKAILDKLDDIQTSADAVKRLFGKVGSVKSLRYLFDDEKSFNRFNDALKKESDFILTRRAAQANSTTAKQLADEATSTATLNDTAQALSSPVGAANMLGKVMGGLSNKKGSDAYVKALEQVGDVLLMKGMNPTKLQDLLRKGVEKQIEDAFRIAIKKELTSGAGIAPVTAGVASESLGSPEQTQ